MKKQTTKIGENMRAFQNNKTFKVVQGSTDHDWLVAFGRDENTEYLKTLDVSFFNFETKELAQDFVNKLNNVALYANHINC